MEQCSPLYIKNRSTDLPQLFVTNNHPQARPGHGAIVIALVDLSPDGLKKMFECGSQFSAPKAGPETIGTHILLTRASLTFSQVHLFFNQEICYL